MHSSNLILIPPSVIFKTSTTSHLYLLNWSTRRQSRFDTRAGLSCCVTCSVLQSSEAAKKKIRKMAEAPNEDGHFPESEGGQDHQGHRGLPPMVSQVSLSPLRLVT